MADQSVASKNAYYYYLKIYYNYSKLLEIHAMKLILIQAHCK